MNKGLLYLTDTDINLEFAIFSLFLKTIFYLYFKLKKSSAFQIRLGSDSNLDLLSRGTLSKIFGFVRVLI